MSRSGYSDYCDGWGLIMYRGAVASAIRGKRGQAFLREMRDALLALEVKELIAGELITTDGGVCALGAVAKARGMNVERIDPDDSKRISSLFDIADSMAREIVYVNDDYWEVATPARRYEIMLGWVNSNIRKETCDGR